MPISQKNDFVGWAEEPDKAIKIFQEVYLKLLLPAIIPLSLLYLFTVAKS